MFIRFFLQTIPYKTQYDLDKKPIFSFADLGFLYLKALVKDLPVRALPITGVPPLGAEDFRWHEVAEAFVYLPRPDERYINVVCGIEENLSKYWTVDVTNVAIISSWPCRIKTASQLLNLSKYDHIVSPRQDDVDALERYGLEAKKMNPNQFKHFLEGLLTKL